MLVGDLCPCHARVAAPTSPEGLQASDETSEEAGSFDRNMDTRGAAKEEKGVFPPTPAVRNLMRSARPPKDG